VDKEIQLEITVRMLRPHCYMGSVSNDVVIRVAEVAVLGLDLMQLAKGLIPMTLTELLTKEIENAKEQDEGNADGQ